VHEALSIRSHTQVVIQAVLRVCSLVQAETADAKAQLEKMGASAKDLGAEKDRTAQQLADAQVLVHEALSY
jgi:hypothetical protein